MITLPEAQAHRPKIENRIDAALLTLEPLVRLLPGGVNAIAELRSSILALEVQTALERELLGLNAIPHPTQPEADF